MNSTDKIIENIEMDNQLTVLEKLNTPLERVLPYSLNTTYLYTNPLKYRFLNRNLLIDVVGVLCSDLNEYVY